MRILFVSNYYPPLELGGYEQNCRDVAEALMRRRHLVSVVTSNYRGAGENYPDIYRVLNTELDLRPFCGTYSILKRSQRLAQSTSRLKSIIDQTKPNVVFVWGMGNLPRELLAVIEGQSSVKVVYYVSDYWPKSPDFSMAHWASPSAHRLTALPKRLLAWHFLRRRVARYQPRFEHAICVSRAVRDRLVHVGLPFDTARIIHNGIDTGPYQKLRPRSAAEDSSPMRIVYAGRLAPEKDVKTIVDGFAEAVCTGLDSLLTIVGNGDAQYVRSLHRLVSRYGLEDRVSFRGWTPRENIPSLLSKFDAFVSASAWEEPLSLSLQQAMAAGLGIIATPCGGTPELLNDGENGLFFPPGDKGSLANQIRRFALEPGLRVRLSSSGRDTVFSHFTIERMTGEIEEYLQEVIGAPMRQTCAPMGRA